MASEEKVLPVFIRDKDLPGDSISPMEMCRTITRIINPSKLEGVQKINNIWRIYLKDKAARLELCVKQTVPINGRHVALYDQNPSIIFNGNGISRQQKDKLTIKNLPLSVSNDEIVKLLEEKKVVLASPIKYGYIRDESGNLTTYKSGDRFVYVEPFDPPLPKQQDIGIFKCLILHHGKMTSCLACGTAGHKIGDINCKAKPKTNILAFKGYLHPLSNHYPCDLDVFGKRFKSIEHAYFWRMSMEKNNKDLAEKIQKSRHAGEAKRLSKEIANDATRWEWEENNVDIMKTLLNVKAEQCSEFKNCLLENRNKVLAEATPSKFWATGLSPYASANTDPEYWPGRNTLGALMMEIAEQLTSCHQADRQPIVHASDTQADVSDDTHTQASAVNWQMSHGNQSQVDYIAKHQETSQMSQNSKHILEK